MISRELRPKCAFSELSTHFFFLCRGGNMSLPLLFELVLPLQTLDDVDAAGCDGALTSQGKLRRSFTNRWFVIPFAAVWNLTSATSTFALN